MAPVVIPDASVLLKWLLPIDNERDQEQALQIRDAAISGDITLKAPSLWLYELGNTLSRHYPKQTPELLEDIRSFGLEDVACTDEWLKQVLALVQRYKVTFYDAAYHASALLEQGLFVTADTQYVKQARQAGSIVLLKDWAN